MGELLTIMTPEEYQSILEDSFERTEKFFLNKQSFSVSEKIEDDADAIFESKTQAYREVLLGCLLVRITDKNKDVHLPYVDMGPNAFSGRSLDEKIINPFLRERRVPCSKRPYLSVFRRQVKFSKATKRRLKDKAGYDAFLRLLDVIAQENEQEKLINFLDYLLYRFILLREETKIELVKLDRISLNQYENLINGLLNRQSGGLLPVILVSSMLDTLNSRLSLGWTIDWQGISVTDKATGAGGDIVIKENEKVLMTIEVTERPVDSSRVIATFTEKNLAL